MDENEVTLSRSVSARADSRTATRAAGAIVAVSLWVVAMAATPTQAQTCTSDAGQALLDPLLTTSESALNTAWPSLAEEWEIDPWDDVWDDEIDIDCFTGTDELCIAYGGVSCKKLLLKANVETITGLGSLQFSDLEVDSLTASAGTIACPFESSADGGPYSCSYSTDDGSGNVSLAAGAELVATVTDIKVKIKCSEWSGGSEKETLYKGSATCTGDGLSASAGFSICGGACESDPTAGAISYVEVTGLEVEASSLSCKVSPLSAEISTISDLVQPTLEDAILDALTPILESALNGWAAEYVPYPAACTDL